MLDQQLKHLFSNYHQAFKAQNIDQVLAYYHLPCTLLTPDKLVLLSTKESFDLEFEKIFIGIKQAGITSFKALEASYAQINNDIVVVNVHWQFFAENDEIIADFYALYHILKSAITKSGQQLKIFQVISHEVKSTLTFPLNLTETVE
ncbi:MAG: hypothetical protein COB35_00270 [Gammaproteobacteria bacterium]|nr:MAG: hypothetical protein COB35_00270 [Gammaproteobacteria bacterium]